MLTPISVSFNTVHIKVIDPDANQWDVVSTLGVGGGAFRCLPFVPASYTMCSGSGGEQYAMKQDF